MAIDNKAQDTRIKAQDLKFGIFDKMQTSLNFQPLVPVTCALDSCLPV